MDSAASTSSLLYGSNTCTCPARLPFRYHPPLKSVTGFAAATVTAAAVALRCWGFIAPIPNGGYGVSLAWQGSMRQVTSGQPTGMGAGGLLGLLVILVVARLVSNGIVEALGRFLL